MRQIWLIAVALLVMAGAVQAQVAAPRLNPHAVEGTRVTPNQVLKAFNPAVLAWNGPSRIGIMVKDLEGTDHQGGTKTPAVTGDGQVFQGRFVGDIVAFSAEVYHMDLDDLGGGSGTFTFDGLTLALSFRIGDVISLGIGQQSGNFAFVTGDESQSMPSAGLTVRLGGLLYLGAAAGTETLDRTTAEADRSVSQVGVALHSDMEGSGYHLEVYKHNAAAIDDPLFGTEDEVDTTAFTAEVKFADLLLSVEQYKSEAVDTGGIVQEEVKETVATVGWVPMPGFMITAGLVKEKETDPFTGNQLVLETKQVALGWAF